MTGSALERLRGRLGGTRAAGWLIGGDTPADAVHSVRQGLLASLLIMVGSWGVGWLAITPGSLFMGSRLLNPLRVNSIGVVVCAVLLVLGSLLLTRAWLRLGQRLQDRWSAPETLRLVRGAAWTWTAPLMLAFPVFSRDVYSYIQQGRQLHAGMDPYSEHVSQLPGWFMGGADSLWAESPSPYGPAFLMIARAIYEITGGAPEAAFTLFKLVSVAGMALCPWALPRLAVDRGRNPAWAVWVSIVNPLFLLYMIAGIHNDSLMMGLMLAGLALLSRRPWPYRSGQDVRRCLIALVLLGLSVAIKPVTLLILPFAAMLLVGRRRALDLRARWAGFLTTGLVAVVVLGLLGMASGLWFGWIPAMMTSGDAAFPYAPWGLLGLGIGWVVEALTPLELRDVADVVYSLGTLIAAGVTAWLALKRRPLDPVWAMTISLFTVVVLAPIIQPWYLVWLLPLAACSLPRTAHRRWTGWVLALVVMVLVVVSVVDQVSVAQWISRTAVRIVTGAVGLAYIVYMVRWDPGISALFRRDRGTRSVIHPDAETTRPDSDPVRRSTP